MALRKLSTLALACLVLLAAGAFVVEANCNVMEGRTYYGSKGHIKTIRWTKNSSHNWNECCAECKKIANCQRWSFYRDRQGNTGCAMYTKKATKLSDSYANTSGKRCSC